MEVYCSKDFMLYMKWHFFFLKIFGDKVKTYDVLLNILQRNRTTRCVQGVRESENKREKILS